MQQWTRIKEAEAGSDLSLALVVDAELFRLDAVIRWLDSADGRIQRAAADRLDDQAAPGQPAVPGERAAPGAPTAPAKPAAAPASPLPGPAGAPGQRDRTPHAN